MTQIITSSIGSYPRIGEEKDHQRLRRALNHLQNKEISSHAFHDVEQSVIQEVVREQILSGLDEVTDGHVTWHDPISHFCRKVAGIQVKGLNRFFDTNTYYRIPVFTGKPKRKEPRLLKDYLFAQSISNKPIRPVLTGPYTLAWHSSSTEKSFTKLSQRLDFFTSLICLEIKDLVSQGAKTIQINEPAIAKFPEQTALIKKSIESLSQVIRPSTFVLAVYFSPLSPIYPLLKTLPVDVLNLDFSYDAKKLFDHLRQSPPDFSIGFGVLNGRTTKLEPIDSILNPINDFIKHRNPEKIYLSSSCGLEYIPRAQAFNKLKLLSKIKYELLGTAALTSALSAPIQ